MISFPRGCRPLLLLTGLAFACAPLLGPTNAPAQSPRGPQPGVIVLRGGEVVRGKVRRVGEFYTVAFADAGEMRLPASAIEIQAVDLDDAYRQLLAKTDTDDAGRQLALAQWCLRQNLLQQAADRLLAATVLAPDHPAIAGVEAQLWLATHPAEAAPQTDTPSESKRVAVERIWDAVPPGAVESFTSAVQPLLLNRCAGCHRPGSGLSFQLLRPQNGRSVPRSFTERNLAAVLAVCDRKSPRESPLLAIPQQAHGGAKPIIHSADAAQWHNVERWIADLTRPEEIRLVGTTLRRDGVLWQPSSAPIGPAQVPPQKTQPTNDKRNVEAERVGASPARPSSSADEVPASGDPFDPEIFNRRYGKDKNADPSKP